MGTNQLSPNLEKLQELLGGSDAGLANINLIGNFFATIGYVLAASIFLVNLGLLVLSGIRDSKDSLGSLLVRLFICILLIYEGPALLQTGFDVGNDFFEATNEKFGTGKIEDYGELEIRSTPKSFFNAVLSSFDEPEELVIDDPFTAPAQLGAYLGKQAAADFAAANLILQAFILIVRAVIFFVIGYNFLKLAVEMINRYMVMVILYLGFSSACGFFASSATEAIFMSYVKMFFTEIFVLLFTKVWVSISLFMMCNVESSFLNAMAILAFINFGVRIEQKLKDMGLTVSTTGGALLDNFVMTAALGIGAITRGTNLGGSGLLNVAAATNNTKLGSLGSALTGKGIAPTNVLGAMQSSMMGQLNASKGKNVPLTASMMKTLDTALRDSSMQGKGVLGSQFKALSAADQKKYLDHLANDGYLSNLQNALKEGSNASLSGIDNGILKGTLDTNIGTRNFAIGDTAASDESIAFVDGNGQQKYVNFTGESTINADSINEPIALACGDSFVDLNDCAHSQAFTMTGLKPNDVMYRGDNDATHYSVTPVGTNGDALFRHNDDLYMAKTKAGIAYKGNYTTAAELQSAFAHGGAFESAGYNNVSNMQQTLDKRGWTFTYADENNQRQDALLFSYVDNMSRAKQATTIVGMNNKMAGTYCIKNVNKKKPKENNTGKK